MNPKSVFEALQIRFGEAVHDLHAEERKDFDSWFFVKPEAAAEVCQYLRDTPELAFNYMECLSGVDYPDKNQIHVVVHAYSYRHKHRVVLKVSLSREDPVMPTLSTIWSAANWQERECFDLLGVRFENHPDLRRILLPEDWVGHPLRKDYKEQPEFHGIPTTRLTPIELLSTKAKAPAKQPAEPNEQAPEPKPAEPAGQALAIQVESSQAYRIHSTHLSKGEDAKPSPSIPMMAGTSQVILEDGATGDEMTLNMGPHHPSTHGVLRFVLKTDGEIIRRAIPDVGYLHRSMEKIAERTSFEGYMPYTDRIDYLASMFANEVWATTCERLFGVEVPKRAQYLRAISCELNRIISHLISLGCMAMDLGAFTPFILALREREFVNDFLEELCGARLTYNYHRIGGVAFDVPLGWADKVSEWVDHFGPMVDEFDRLITFNDIFVKRCANVAVITGKEAVDWGLVGPNLRASGVRWDIRRDDPYGVYPEIDFEIPIGKGMLGTVGDCFDRFWVRVEEMRQSALVVKQCLQKMNDHPVNDIQGKLPKKLRAEGEAYAHVESARGDLGCYVIANGKDQPYRARFRTGSFTTMGIMEPKSPGLFVADLVALISSVDVVAPEIDR